MEIYASAFEIASGYCRLILVLLGYVAVIVMIYVTPYASAVTVMVRMVIIGTLIVRRHYINQL